MATFEDEKSGSAATPGSIPQLAVPPDNKPPAYPDDKPPEPQGRDQQPFFSDHAPFIRWYMSIRRAMPADAILFYRYAELYAVLGDDANKLAYLVGGLRVQGYAGFPSCTFPKRDLKDMVDAVLSSGCRVAVVDEEPELHGGVMADTVAVLLPRPRTARRYDRDDVQSREN